MSGHHIELLNTQTLVPNARNARVHSNKHVKQIAKSISEFGFTNPVLMTIKMELLRVMAACLQLNIWGWLKFPASGSSI